MEPIYSTNPNYVEVIAEIGINHNGDIELAKNMIHSAFQCGADFVKFQKRTVDIVYTHDELSRVRPNKFGSTNGDLKRGLEFGHAEYRQIDEYCHSLGIPWFASPWDIPSVEFLNQFDSPAIKIASACLTDKDLLIAAARTGKKVILSTGMSTPGEIVRAAEIVAKHGTLYSIMHCTSAYPCVVTELNLSYIPVLAKLFPDVRIGYSGHETGVPTTVMAISLGAKVIERHFTLSRAMWGSDQAASLEPEGMRRVVSAARAWPDACGDGVKHVYKDEMAVMQKLRRVETLFNPD